VSNVKYMFCVSIMSSVSCMSSVSRVSCFKSVGRVSSVSNVIKPSIWLVRVACVVAVVNLCDLRDQHVEFE